MKFPLRHPNTLDDLKHSAPAYDEDEEGQQPRSNLKTVFITMKMRKLVKITGYFSGASFVDFGTFPLLVMFFIAFSLAILILC